jgi:metacaspase-1
MPKAVKRTSTPAAARGRAITIGLNSVNPKHYAGWPGPLVACEADAEDMATIAKAAGFTTKTLRTRQATRGAVIAELTAAAAALRSGDILMVSYSGHGGQLPDQDGDETDLRDETWCLYDGELVDDELLRIWIKFKAGVRILVFSDSCHSGTVIRARYQALAASGGLHAVMERPPVERDSLLARFRAMPPNQAVRTYRQNRKFYDPILKQPAPSPAAVKASVLLISGCQDNQLSSDGDFNGLFTGRLKLVWNDGRFAGEGYEDFRKEISSKMPPTQSPQLDHALVRDPAFLGQRPFTI